MKNFKVTYIFTIAAAALLSVATSACKDDAINPVDPNIPDSEIPAGETMYMAIRVYNAAAIDSSTRTRAGDEGTGGDEQPPYHFDDSQSGDYTQHDSSFNIGSDPETAVSTDSNYILVFSQVNPDTPGAEITDADYNDSELEYLLPLNPYEEEYTSSVTDDKSGYKSYKTFYTSAEKYRLPESFENRRAMVVLNAKDNLKAKLNACLNQKKKYSQVLELEVGEFGANYSDQDLYFSNDVTTFFTMSSSMVFTKANEFQGKSEVDSKVYRPAVIKRNFNWQATKDLAAQNPVISFFIERLQSKVSLTFNSLRNQDDQIRYYLAANDGEVETETTESETIIKYQAKKNLIFEAGESKDFKPADEWKTIRYIKEYERQYTPETAPIDPDEEDESGDGNDTVTEPDLNAQVTEEEEEVIEYLAQTTKNWKINVTGWNINAVKKQEYLFKNLFKNNTSKADYYTGWQVNNLDPYRNFWSESVNYSNEKFPAQFRRAYYLQADERNPSTILIKDNSLDYWKTEDDDVDYTYHQLYLKYFTYSELAKKSLHQYAAENTYDKSIYSDGVTTFEKLASTQEHLRAGSHVIVTAQLLIDGFDEDAYESEPTGTNPLVANVEDKYYMNGVFWTKDAYIEYVLEYLGYWMQKEKNLFPNSNGYLYTGVTQEMLDSQEIEIDEVAQGIEPSDEAVAHATDFDITPLHVKGSDGMVSIKRKDSNTKIYYYNTEDRKYVEIEAIPWDETNPKADLFQLLVFLHPEYFAKLYKEGRMYYAIPVEHYKNATATAPYTAQYGMVRNHWYSFNVTSFSAPGTPVAVPEQLIIPNNDLTCETLGITLAIFPWHTINARVNIEDQRPVVSDRIDADLWKKVEDWNYEGQEFGNGKNDGW